MFIIPNVRDWYVGQALAGYLAAHAGDEIALPKRAEIAAYVLALADELMRRREGDKPAPAKSFATSPTSAVESSVEG